MKSKEFISLAKALLPSLKGFTVRPPMIFVLPIGHTLRGLYFEGSDFDSKSFYVWVFFLPLYIPTRHISFSFGKRLGGTSQRWSIDESNLILKLSSSIRDEAIPFLDGLSNPLQVAEAIESLMKEGNNPYLQQALAYSFAFGGKIERAVTELDRLLELLDASILWQREIRERGELLKQKITKQPKEVREQLEVWIVESLTNLRLSKFRGKP
jgi:hypothetical protein